MIKHTDVPTSGIPEFFGPDQVGDACKAAISPQYDGAIVKNIIDNNQTNVLAGMIQDAASDMSIFDDQAPQVWNVLRQMVPQLQEVDDIIQSYWEELTFAGSSLALGLQGSFFAVDTIELEPHIDIVPFDAHLKPQANHLWCGPLAASFCLDGLTEIGLQKYPKNEIATSKGRLSRAKVFKKKESIYNGDTYPDVDSLRSRTEQGAGDIVFWVHPTTIHGVKPLTPNRTALVAEQEQIQ